MRNLIAAAMPSLDGAMQAPGGPDEDRSGAMRTGSPDPAGFMRGVHLVATTGAQP